MMKKGRTQIDFQDQNSFPREITIDTEHLKINKEINILK